MRPYFVADAATVTVMRPLASSAFGRIGFTLPDGVEISDLYELSADGNEVGYVAHLSDRRVGGIARRFVRADVNITTIDDEGSANASSDVDAVLTDAKARVASDFFLESDISRAGLGTWREFVDFTVGDMVDVEVWGRVVTLPVTRIEPVVSDFADDDVRVHVGGQLVDDERARLVENAAIHRAVLADRKELLELSDSVKSAQSVAADALAAASVAVVASSYEYVVSSSDTTAPTSGWVSYVPSREPGEFLWQRTVNTFGDGRVERSQPVLVTGNTGAAGSQGVSVTSVTRFWRWADTNPGTPTGTANPSGWSTTQPAYVVGQKLWTTTRTIFSNGTASWAPTTEEASVSAATAISTAAANDKNKIWYASTTPGSTQGSRPGDTWFQYSGTTIVGQWKWSGSAWEPQQIGNQVIANLDAGKITTGFLDAQRIQSGTITATQVNADEIFLKADGDKSLQQQWDDFGVQLYLMQGSIQNLSRVAKVANSTRRGIGLASSGGISGSAETKSLFTTDVSKIYATGAWKGRFIVIDSIIGSGMVKFDYVELSGTNSRSASFTGSYGAVIIWERDPFTPFVVTLKPTATWDAPQNAWTTVPGMSMNLDWNARSVSISGKVFFTNVNRGSTYGVRVLIGGNVVWTWQSNTFGPLTSLGGTTWSVPVNVECDVSGSQDLQVQVLCGDATPSKRRVTTATQVAVTSYLQD